MKRLQKQALAIDECPEILVGNDIKMELISQFDWFKDIPKQTLDDVIATTPEKEYADMAEDVNEFVRKQIMNNITAKSIYTNELSREIRWLIVRALGIDKYDLIVDLNPNGHAADPSIFSKPLMFSLTLYNARRLKSLQQQGYIKFDSKYQGEFYGEEPLSLLPDGKIDQIIRQAHDTALSLMFKNRVILNTMTKIAESRLNVITDEFWVRKGIRQ